MPTKQLLPRADATAMIVFLLLSFSAAAVGSIAVSGSLQSWYAALQKPPFNPPNWVFGPVWTALYLMIAFSGWLVWLRRAETSVSLPLSLFGIQLALNALWSVIFFGFHEIGLAAAEIVALWTVTALYAAVSWKISKAAALLMSPYLAWVAFATLLNISILVLNSG
jgi:benzodiazapine receptor